MMFISFEGNLLESFLWFKEFDFGLNVLFMVATSIVTSIYIGKIAGKRILIDLNNPILIGITSGLAVLVATTFFTSWFILFREGIHNLKLEYSSIVEYFIKPMFWIILIGFTPVIILGARYGKSIKSYKTND